MGWDGWAGEPKGVKFASWCAYNSGPNIDRTSTSKGSDNHVVRKGEGDLGGGGVVIACQTVRCAE